MVNGLTRTKDLGMVKSELFQALPFPQATAPWLARGQKRHTIVKLPNHPGPQSCGLWPQSTDPPSFAAMVKSRLGQKSQLIYFK